VTDSIRYPRSASVYEIVRTRPGARERLDAAGVTPHFVTYRVADAARELGVPVERLAQIAETGAR
jgi:hypothetical protein